MSWNPSAIASAADTCGAFAPAILAQLFQDSAASTPVTAGNQPLGCIKALFGTGARAFDLSQPTTGAKLTYKTDGSLHWLEADGGDWLDSGVGRFGRAGLHAAATESWGVYIACTSGNGSLLARCSATGSAKTLQILSYPGADMMTTVVRGGPVLEWDSTPAIADATPQIVGLRWTGSALLASNRNTTAAITSSVGTAAEETGQRIVVGARTNGTAGYLPSGGKIYAIFLIDRAPTDAEHANIMWWLAQQAGVSGVGVEPSGGSAHTPGSATGLAAATPTTSALSQHQATGQPIPAGLAQASTAPLQQRQAPDSAASLGIAQATAPAAQVHQAPGSAAPVASATTASAALGQVQRPTSVTATAPATPVSVALTIGSNLPLVAVAAAAHLQSAPISQPARPQPSTAAVQAQPVTADLTQHQRPTQAVATVTAQVQSPTLTSGEAPTPVPAARYRSRSVNPALSTASATVALRSRSRTPSYTTRSLTGDRHAA